MPGVFLGSRKVALLHFTDVVMIDDCLVYIMFNFHSSNMLILGSGVFVQEY